MPRRRPAGRGFTLVELLIALAIIGVLISIGVPAYVKYSMRSQSTEATLNLNMLYNATVSYYEAEHTNSVGATVNHLFPPNQGYTPAASCCSAGGKCVPDPAHWETPAWRALSFHMADPHRYQYAAMRAIGDGTAVGHRYDLSAMGDLNCDGIIGLLVRPATVVSGLRLETSGTTAFGEIQ